MFGLRVDSVPWGVILKSVVQLLNSQKAPSPPVYQRNKQVVVVITLDGSLLVNIVICSVVTGIDVAACCQVQTVILSESEGKQVAKVTFIELQGLE